MAFLNHTVAPTRSRIQGRRAAVPHGGVDEDERLSRLAHQAECRRRRLFDVDSRVALPIPVVSKDEGTGTGDGARAGPRGSGAGSIAAQHVDFDELIHDEAPIDAAVRALYGARAMTRRLSYPFMRLLQFGGTNELHALHRSTTSSPSSGLRRCVALYVPTLLPSHAPASTLLRQCIPPHTRASPSSRMASSRSAY
jgi:hypothetical protein